MGTLPDRKRRLPLDHARGVKERMVAERAVEGKDPLAAAAATMEPE